MTKDTFQTPPYALEPLLPFLPITWRIWEPACGKGNIVRALKSSGHCVFGSDVVPAYYGAMKGADFLGELGGLVGRRSYDAIVTNPPYSRLDDWIARCFELGKPFALLVPVTALGGKRRQSLYRNYGGVSLIMFGERIPFETPTGKAGKESSPQFETCWMCWNLPGLENGRILFKTIDA